MAKMRWAAAAAVCSLLLVGCAVLPLTARQAVIPAVPDAQQGDTTPEPISAAQPQGAAKRQHVDIHGIYLTGWVAGSDLLYERVAFMKAAGLNAVVIDVQDDDGYISWETEIPLAVAIGAHEWKISNIKERLQFLKENGIYTIGRIVVYADPLLGKGRPDLAIMGGQFIDSRGIRWPDPYNREVWAYKVAIAREAAEQGFDEIQFDYIRFPEHRIEGYNYKVPVKQRTEAIEGFLRYAKAELEPYGILISADLFGLTTSVAEGDDMEIGQDYAAIAGIVDYVKPMVYPSHYAPGTYGVSDPNAEPGRIVYESLVAAQQRTWSMERSIHRPWIQDFTYGKAYTAADIEAQIKGLAEAGVYQWIIWDPSNQYTRGVDYGVGGGRSGPPGAWAKAFAAEKAREQAVRVAQERMLGRSEY